MPESPFLKRDSDTGVFLWILLNFKEHLFYRATPGDCFCSSKCPKKTCSDKFWEIHSNICVCIEFVVGLQPHQKRLWYRCLSVNFEKKWYSFFREQIRATEVEELGENQGIILDKNSCKVNNITKQVFLECFKKDYWLSVLHLCRASWKSEYFFINGICINRQVFTWFLYDS